MKKTSTVAVKETKNFSPRKLTIGLDLGDRSSWYCLLDEAGDVLLEQKLATTPKAMREGFGAIPGCRIALETGMHSPWVSRVLTELGHEVIVAHARNVRLIGESRKKDDRLDARTLARLARIDPQLLCPVKHRSAKALCRIRSWSGYGRPSDPAECAPAERMGYKNGACSDDSALFSTMQSIEDAPTKPCRRKGKVRSSCNTDNLRMRAASSSLLFHAAEPRELCRTKLRAESMKERNN